MDMRISTMPQNSQSLEKVLLVAAEKAGTMGTASIGVSCLVVAIAAEGTSGAATLLKNEGLSADVLERTARNLFGTWQTDTAATLAQAPLAREAQNMLKSAETTALQAPHSHVTPTHVLHHAVTHHEGEKLIKTALLAVQKAGGSDGRSAADRYQSLTKNLAEAVKTNVNGLPANEKATALVLDQFTVDLTKLARENKLTPIVGRKKEIRRAIEVLGRESKNNPVFIGEPGVGKTAIAEGLAIEIVADRVPKSLKGKRILRLDLVALVAGTRYRGDFEDRMKALLSELKAANDIIIFIDELHTLIGAGAAAGAMDASNTLKPALARGELTAIGATTLGEFRHIEKDGALERRFQPITVDPSSVEDTIEILKGRRPKLEAHHGVSISDAALVSAAHLADRHITERFLPDKAIDVVDEAASALAIDAPGSTLGEEHVCAKVSQLSGVKLDKLQADEANRLARMEDKLHERVIGQKQAISAVSRAIRRARSGLKNPNSPIGSFLFLGPTGVGKTEVARALQEFLFDDERTLIRIDMSEYMEKHSVARLIGPPPGYVGYEAGGQLTEKVRRRPYSVVLLDEIEKAHPDVFNILLQIFEDGRLTDGHGRTVSFKNTVIIMTSNIAASKLAGIIGGGASGPLAHDVLLEMVMPHVKLVFSPELLNRIDEVVCFTQLTEDEIGQILEHMLTDLGKRLHDSHKAKFSMEGPARSVLMAAGYDPKYGARPMKRAIQRLIEDPLAERIVDGRLKDGGAVGIGTTPDGTTLTFNSDASGSALSLAKVGSTEPDLTLAKPGDEFPALPLTGKDGDGTAGSSALSLAKPNGSPSGDAHDATHSPASEAEPEARNA